MTNRPMCFPLGVVEGAAEALTDGDVEFFHIKLHCLFYSQTGIILWGRLECFYFFKDFSVVFV